MTNAFRSTVAPALIKIDAICVFAGIAATAISLFASIDPANVRDFARFEFLYGCVVMVFAGMGLIKLAVQSWYIDPIAPRMYLLASGLLLGRVWDRLSLYPEVVALCSFFAVLAVAYSYIGARSTANMQSISGASRMAPAYQSSDNQESNDSIIGVRTPRHTFREMIGMDDVKSRLLKAGQEVLGSGKAGSKARNGILLTGKPGNGKTFVAEALAGELGLPFLTLTFDDVASKWIGDTPERVVKAFNEARAHAPCVLFLDEVDSLLSSRDTPSGNSEEGKTTNILLRQLVDIRGCGVVVIAASNYIRKLDPAAIREGRFDFKVEVTAPDAKAREHLIRTTAKRPIERNALESAVRRWEGFSVSRITAVMEEINRMPAGQGTPITFNQMKVALRTIQGRMGDMPENTPLLSDLVMSESHKAVFDGLAMRMEKIDQVEAMGGSVPRGVLFHGAAGTGKSVTARALAKSAGWAFLSVSGLDLMSKPDRIDDLLDEASDLRPCVVFIDEADDVFGDRRGSNVAALTNKLLTTMDGSGGKVPDLLFVAATNHPESFDPAALRGGRFTEKVEFFLPRKMEIEVFIEKWAAGSKASLGKDVSIEELADQLQGNPLANVKEVLQMAVNNAIARMDANATKAVVGKRDLERAIETVCV